MMFELFWASSDHKVQIPFLKTVYVWVLSLLLSFSRCRILQIIPNQTTITFFTFHYHKPAFYQTNSLPLHFKFFPWKEKQAFQKCRTTASQRQPKNTDKLFCPLYVPFFWLKLYKQTVQTCTYTHTHWGRVQFNNEQTVQFFIIFFCSFSNLAKQFFPPTSSFSSSSSSSSFSAPSPLALSWSWWPSPPPPPLRFFLSSFPSLSLSHLYLVGYDLTLFARFHTLTLFFFLSFVFSYLKRKYWARYTNYTCSK